MAALKIKEGEEEERAEGQEAGEYEEYIECLFPCEINQRIKREMDNKDIPGYVKRISFKTIKSGYWLPYWHFHYDNYPTSYIVCPICYRDNKGQSILVRLKNKDCMLYYILYYISNI